jgi:hypothetical protein
MNSYNENLNSVVVTSLQSQNLDEQSIYSKLNASMFTLYYAEGATITAEEKLVQDEGQLKIKQATMHQAVENTNLSNNLLASATQANQYYKQSINNMAVCAANVQVAANAIVKLASDVGSIFSIVHAADRKSDIFADTDKVRALVDNTAHAAEIASKLAMETAMYTAEVSVPTLLDKAKSANLAINNLLTITSTDFNNISATVNADDVTLAAASAKEKLAEGVLEDIGIDYRATKGAYNSTNKELNLDLWVAYLFNSVYNISFNPLENPFYKEVTVDSYYVIVVKNTKKATFSMSNAESIRINNAPNQFIPVGFVTPTIVDLVIDFLQYEKNVKTKGYNPYVDSDGEDIKLGEKYVVFVMAVYNDAYKREINNFDDFLSAPSKHFVLTTKLRPVDKKTIKVEKVDQENKTEEDIKIELDFKFSQNLTLKLDFDYPEDTINISEYTHQLTFRGLPAANSDLKYRCIFLPETYKLRGKLLTAKKLNKMITHVARTARDTEKAALRAQIEGLSKKLNTVDKKIIELEGVLKKLASGVHDKNTKKLLEEQAELASLKADQADIIESIFFADLELIYLNDNVSMSDDFEFFFNTKIAEQISAGNYTIPVAYNNPSDVAGAPNWLAYIGSETTDNFGNFLIPGNEYIPIILTTSTDSIDNPTSYVNALSGINLDSKFTFEPKP